MTPIKESMPTYRASSMVASLDTSSPLTMTTMDKPGKRALICSSISLSSTIADGQVITPHKLRSSFAMSFYEASGNDILLLKHKLHHSSINTTNIYAEAAKGKKEETRNILQGLR